MLSYLWFLFKRKKYECHSLILQLIRSDGQRCLLGLVLAQAASEELGAARDTGVLLPSSRRNQLERLMLKGMPQLLNALSGKMTNSDLNVIFPHIISQIMSLITLYFVFVLTMNQCNSLVPKNVFYSITSYIICTHIIFRYFGKECSEGRTIQSTSITNKWCSSNICTTRPLGECT